MKLTRTLALIAGAALALAACSKSPDTVSSIVEENSNPLLAHVPADSMYVFAALEPVPDDIMDIYISRAQPVLSVLSDHVNQIQADLDAGKFEGRKEARLANAVLDELGGEVSIQSLEKLGISPQAHSVFYAMGVFPVIRFELTDAQALRDAIGRIEAKVEVSMPQLQSNGTNYWRIWEDGMPVAAYIAILDEQFAFSVFPINAENDLLASFLGQDMPVESMASTNALAQLNDEKGYTPYGSGMIDFNKLADEILDPESMTHTYLGQKMDFDPTSLDPVCVAEFRSIIAKAPRATAGTTALTANEIGFQYELELDSPLATGLAALVSDVPVAGDGDYLLSASLAVKVGKLRSYLLEKANAIVASPYQCAEMEELNRNAAQLAQQLNIPMPPMVNNLLGIRVQLDDIDPTGDVPSGEGLMALHVDKPEMFVGMATMMVPGFQELDLPNQTEPVRIPEQVLHMEGLDVFALMGESAIGVAVGEQHAGDLAGFMNSGAASDGTFFSMSTDMGRQFALQNTYEEKYDIEQHGKGHFHHDLMKAIESSYAEIFDRSRVDMRITGSGLVIDSRVTFK